MTLYYPHPSQITPQWDTGGSGESMGSVTDVDSKCRFWLDVERCYTLAWIKAGFESVSSDTGTATLFIKVDSRLCAPDKVGDVGAAALTSPLDFTLQAITARGVGASVAAYAPVALRITPEELCFYTFQKGDIMVLEWANPDDQMWGVEVGLFDSSNSGGFSL